jgi:hypothetical protein
MSDEKIKVRITESGDELEVVVLRKRADRIEVVVGKGQHSVTCDLTPTRTEAAYSGKVMGREIVYERSRADVAAEIEHAQAFRQSRPR